MLGRTERRAGERRDDRERTRRDEVSELIREPGEGSAYRLRRHLVQVCRDYAPSASIATVELKAQSGISSRPRPAHNAIIARRPNRCESAPKRIPPAIAPTAAMELIVPASAGESLCWPSKNALTYGSCVPCDMKLNAAMNRIA